MAAVRQQTVKENTNGGVSRKGENTMNNYFRITGYSEQEDFLLYNRLLRNVREIMAIQLVSTAKRLENIRSRQRD